MKKQHKKRTIITKENKDTIMSAAFQDFKSGKYTMVALAKKHGISQSTMTRYITKQMHDNKYGIHPIPML